MKYVLFSLMLMFVSTHVEKELHELLGTDLPDIVQHERGFRRSLKQLTKELYNEKN